MHVWINKYQLVPRKNKFEYLASPYQNNLFPYKLSYVLKVVGHYGNGKSSDSQNKAYLSDGGIVVILTQFEDINGVLEYSMKSDDIRRIYESNLILK